MPEAKFLAVFRRAFGYNTMVMFSRVFGGDGIYIAARVEFLRSKPSVALADHRRKFDDAVLVAGYRYVIGNGQDVVRIHPVMVRYAFLGVAVAAAAEVHRLRVLDAFDLPGKPSRSQGSGYSTWWPFSMRWWNMPY